MSETSGKVVFNTGQREAAAIIFMMGEKHAANIVRRLSPGEIRSISDAIINLPQLSSDDFVRAIERFERDYDKASLINTDVRSQIQGIMQNAFGKVHADSLLNSMEDRQGSDRLTGLQNVRPEALASVIQKEQIQMQVAVLSCLSPQQAADILAILPEENQPEIIRRMSSMDHLPKMALQRIADFLEDFLQESHQEAVISLQGQSLAAEILNQMDKKHADGVMEQFKAKDEALAASVESKMFSFEHISRLTPESIRIVVSKSDQKQLALAMKGTTEEFQKMIYGVMAKRAAQYLKDDFEGIGRVSLNAVNKARKEIQDHMLLMLHANDIEMKSKDDELIE